jgi:hypothetical protein
MSKLMLGICQIVGMLVISIPFSLLNAYILADMWQMFIVPLGIMSITVMHAWGISLFVSMFLIGLIQPPVDQESPVLNLITKLFNNTLASLILWGMSTIIFNYYI